MTKIKIISFMAAWFIAGIAAHAQETVVSADTLNVGDSRLSIVLRDDHTWYFAANEKNTSVSDVFRKNWKTDTVNPYDDIPLSKLPSHNSICLVDSASVFVSPVKAKVFSSFGFRHGQRHQGVDLPLTMGTPVVSAFDGRVRASFNSPVYGNIVIVRHENGLESFYSLLSERKVAVGDWVHAGDVIGLGGSTGLATAPHLHFELRFYGYAIDPEWVVDFETGTLRSSLFILKRDYLDTSSRYVPASINEEELVYGGDEKVAAEEARIAAEKAAIRYHKVKQGDTVSAICHKYGISMAKIKSLNPKLNVDRISLGQNIRVN